MLSGIGPGAHLQHHGIAVAHDPSDVVQVVGTSLLTELFGPSFAGVVTARNGIFERRRSRTGLLTTNFAEAGGFIKSQPELSQPDLQPHFVIARLVDRGRTAVFGQGVSCHVGLIAPQNRGSLTFASNDPFAAPLIEPDFLVEGCDLEDR